MTTKSIAAAESQRATKLAELDAIEAKAASESRTLNADEQTQFDDGMDDVKKLDAHLTRLKAFAEIKAPAAVTPSATVPTASVPAANVLFQRSNADDVPGLMLARMLQAKGVAVLKMRQGEMVPAHEVATQMFKDDPRVGQVLKSAQVAGSTLSGTWAADLLTTDGGPFAAFVEYLRPKTILGRFGQGNVPALRTVPFYAPIGSQTNGGAGYWVGEGKGKGLTQFDYDKTNLVPYTVANIVVATNRLLQNSAINASVQFRDQLVAALRARIDTDFIDPAKAVDAGISPASITNNVSTPNASGTTADAVRTDIKALFSTFIAANQDVTGCVWIMSTATALALSMMVNGLGQPEFPGISMTGGTFQGLPVIASEFVATPTAGSYIWLVNANEIFLADENGFTVDMSTEASLEFDSAPTQSSVASVTATALVSMFQTNSVAFRAERTLSWAKARSTSVAGIDTVNYGEGS